MPTDRFLTQFDTNVTGAIAALEPLAIKVTQIEARLNALGGRAAQAQSFAGIGQAAQAANVNVGQFSNTVQAATARLQSIKAGGAAAGIAAVGTAASTAEKGLARAADRAIALGQVSAMLGDARGLRSSMNSLQFIGNQMAAMGLPTQRLAQNFQNFRTQLQAIPPAAAQVNTSVTQLDGRFASHIRRIEATIFAYAAFAGALAAVKSAIDLSATIDRESRRLQAVLDIGPEATRNFIGGLADIAVETVTPIEKLIGEADFMASAFANVEDPVRRTASALELANQVGRVTTVTQRDVATETENVIAVMTQANIPIDRLGDVLGKVTVAGNQSSTVIAAILDALQGSTAAAQTAGVDLDTLIALISRFRNVTQRSGTEIGNTFKTLFATITGEKAQNDLEELTNGIVSVRDEAGNLKSFTQIMIELVNAADRVPEVAARLPEIFKALTPPLQPGAVRDLQIIFDIFKDLGPDVERIAKADADALAALVTQINASLPTQFLQFLEEAKRAFIELFEPGVVSLGQDLINVLRGIGDVLGAIPPDVLQLIAKFAAFFAIVRTGSFLLRGFSALLGVSGLITAARGATAAMEAAGLSVGTFTTAINAAKIAASRFLPLLIAMAAIEIGSKAIDEASGMDILKSAGFSEAQVQTAFHNGPTKKPGENRFLPGTRPNEAGGSTTFGPGGIIDTGPVTANQAENLKRLAQALQAAKDSGTLTAESQEAMKSAILNTDGSIKDVLISIDDIIGAFAKATSSAGDVETGFDRAAAAAAALKAQMDPLLDAEGRAAEASRLATQLVEERVDALEKLDDRLSSGEITAAQHAQGIEDINRAAQLASEVVAAYGDRLAQIPQLEAAAAQGSDALTKALFRQILQSTDNIDAIGAMIQRLIALGPAAAQIAQVLKLNPLVITMAVQRRDSAFEAANPEIKTARNFAQNQVGINPINQLRSIEAEINKILSSLGSAFSRNSSTVFGTGAARTSGGAAGGGPDNSIIDIGDLSPAQISQIISIAKALQAKIPGAAEEGKNDIVSFIKDAKFLQTVRGIDDRLLRLAIEELTDNMEEANRLEQERLKNEQVLRNLVVNTGPLGALVSQPTAFGLAGSIAAGTGLNFNPEQGNFVINVPVELKGLEPAALQQLIYDIISKAIRDALRL